MPPTKLADTRTLTLDDAKAIFADLAQAEIRLAKLDAQTEDRIARLKAEHAAAAEPLSLARDAHARRLTEYILANPTQFVRPRAIATDFGRFGRRTVSNVLLSDQNLVTQWALGHGYADVVQTIHKLAKPALAKRLRDGETVPGATLQVGEEAFYAIDKALVTDQVLTTAAT